LLSCFFSLSENPPLQRLKWHQEQYNHRKEASKHAIQRWALVVGARRPPGAHPLTSLPELPCSSVKVKGRAVHFLAVNNAEGCEWQHAIEFCHLQEMRPTPSAYILAGGLACYRACAVSRPSHLCRPLSPNSSVQQGVQPLLCCCTAKPSRLQRGMRPARWMHWTRPACERLLWTCRGTVPRVDSHCLQSSAVRFWRSCCRRYVWRSR
jgi:hypothetical protein